MVTTFSRLATCNLRIVKGWEFLLPLWTRNSLRHRFKMFLFKYFNNTLGLNARVSHFNDRQTRTCALCTARNDDEQEDESFFHLFYDCITTRIWHEQLIAKCFPDIAFTITNKKELWFYGVLPNQEKFNQFQCLFILLFQYHIWQSKWAKKIFSFHTLISNFKEDFREIYYNDGKLKNDTLDSNNLLRRLVGAYDG